MDPINYYDIIKVVNCERVTYLEVPVNVNK